LRETEGIAKIIKPISNITISIEKSVSVKNPNPTDPVSYESYPKIHGNSLKSYTPQGN